MLPTAATQLLIVLLLVALWLQWHRYCKKQTLRERNSRQQAAAHVGINPEVESPPPKAVLVEQEPTIDVVADSTSTATEELEAVPRVPTGVTCVVRKGRQLLRCTEFEVAGELETEVVRVSRHGTIRGESSVHNGSFRTVADELLKFKVV